MAKTLEALARQANQFYSAGKYSQAKVPLKEILTLQPNNDSVLNMMAFAENQCGKRNISYKLLDQALAINPNNPNSYDLKGFLYAEDGNYAAAEEIYKRGLSINPNMPAMQKNLGMMFFKQGKFPQAIQALACAVVLQPDNKEFKQLYTSASADCPLMQFNKNDKQAIIICLQDPILSHKFLTNNWTLILHNDPTFKILREWAHSDFNKDFFIDNEDELKKVLNNEFLLFGLKRNYIANIYYEDVLTKVRKIFSDLIINEDYNMSGFQEFIVSLAIQSWINEYVFSSAPEEDKRIEKLKSEIEDKNTFNNSDINNLCLLSSYFPLYKLKNAKAILAINRRDNFLKDLITLQIKQPFAEEDIKKTVPLLKSVGNEVSAKVREQYEENPYPRWQSINNDLEINVISNKKMDILVAGCGTGQEPAAMTQVYPEAKFFCIDLSLSSIAYAVRQTRKINLSDRMEFMQADILDLSGLDKKFDAIYSSGVLHHMKDPEAGLRVLSGLLKPKAKMYISLYSENARKNVVAARKYIKNNDIPSTPQGIRQMREIIKKSDDPLLKKCADVADFFTLSQCRDLMFHVQEHRFTLDQIKEILVRNDLEFGGMFSLTNEKLQKFKQKFPKEDDFKDIDKWHIFEQENPDLFKHGMYSFIFSNT